VTRGPVLVLTCAPDELDRFWLNSYAPEVIEVEARRYPPVKTIAALSGSNAEVVTVPIPLHCTDGFSEAYFGRPECLLNPGARLANSAWSFVDASVGPRLEVELGGDLASGAWDANYGHLRRLSELRGSLKLIAGKR
jgi:hypothetical protein